MIKNYLTRWFTVPYMVPHRCKNKSQTSLGELLKLPHPSVVAMAKALSGNLNDVSMSYGKHRLTMQRPVLGDCR